MIYREKASYMLKLLIWVVSQCSCCKCYYSVKFIFLLKLKKKIKKILSRAKWGGPVSVTFVLWVTYNIDRNLLLDEGEQFLWSLCNEQRLHFLSQWQNNVTTVHHFGRLEQWGWTTVAKCFAQKNAHADEL